jgi:recombinational DNA repair protein (RecF pathway)
VTDRKYRQRGYMDKEPVSRGPREPHEPRKERLEGAPRGRTAGGFGPEVFKCARCGEPRRSLDQDVPFDAVCAKCGADLHTCSNCKNFDTSARWECRVWEQIPARISPKDVRNDCTLMSPRIVKDLAADKAGKIETPDDARKAFDALFKK